MGTNNWQETVNKHRRDFLKHYRTIDDIEAGIEHAENLLVLAKKNLNTATNKIDKRVIEKRNTPVGEIELNNILNEINQCESNVHFCKQKLVTMKKLREEYLSINEYYFEYSDVYNNYVSWYKDFINIENCPPTLKDFQTYFDIPNEETAKEIALSIMKEDYEFQLVDEYMQLTIKNNRLAKTVFINNEFIDDMPFWVARVIYIYQMKHGQAPTDDEILKQISGLDKEELYKILHWLEDRNIMYKYRDNWHRNTVSTKKLYFFPHSKINNQMYEAYVEIQNKKGIKVKYI